MRDIRNPFEQEAEERYYKPVIVGNFWSNDYIEYKSNCDRNKTLSIEEYHNKIRLFLNCIINDLQKSDLWKIQLTIAINFVSSKENGEDLVMHSKSDNIEFMIYDNTDEVTEELLESLRNRYQLR